VNHIELFFNRFKSVELERLALKSVILILLSFMLLNVLVKVVKIMALRGYSK
jgi:hypothetical protein